MMNYYGGWGMMRYPAVGVGWIVGLLFWIAVGMLFILVIKSLFFRGSGKPYEDVDENAGKEKTETAVDILKKRYAKGEITLKEYEKMKKDIQ